jgi:hypothetical protein
MDSCQKQLQSAWRLVQTEKENVEKAIAVLKDIDCKDDASEATQRLTQLHAKLAKLEEMVFALLGDGNIFAPQEKELALFCADLRQHVAKVHAELRDILRQAVEAGEVCKLRKSLPSPSDASFQSCADVIRYWDNKLRTQLLRLVHAAPQKSAKKYVETLLAAQKQLNDAVNQSRVSDADCERISSFLRGPFQQYVLGLLTLEGVRRLN